MNEEEEADDGEPLSDKRFQQIIQKCEGHWQAFESGWDTPDALHDYVCDVPDLLGEVNRLREELRRIKASEE